MKKTSSLHQLIIYFLIFILAMLSLRFYYTQSLQFAFLVWNIFLAYIPFAIAQYLSLQYLSKKKNWVFYIGMGLWLLFFPNALYIVTDLMHLQLTTTVPKWFDVIVLFSSGLLGLLFAFVSLYMIEQLIKPVFSTIGIKLVIFLILLSASFGVYLGRFLRWNSWDIINNPFTLLKDIFYRIALPQYHMRTWGVTIIFGVLFYLIYSTIKMLPKILVKYRPNISV